MLIFSAEHIYNCWLRTTLKNMTQNSLIISPIISIPFKPKVHLQDIFQHVRDYFPCRNRVQYRIFLQERVKTSRISQHQVKHNRPIRISINYSYTHTHTLLFPTHMHRHQRTLIHFQNLWPGRTIVLASQVVFSQAQCLGQRAIFCIGVRTDWEGE